MASIGLSLRVARSIGEVAAEAWDACANPGCGTIPPSALASVNRKTTSTNTYNPFISHDFLYALEIS
jgi:predicted N-acyltransferase